MWMMRVLRSGHLSCQQPLKSNQVLMIIMKRLLQSGPVLLDPWMNKLSGQNVFPWFQTELSQCFFKFAAARGFFCKKNSFKYQPIFKLILQLSDDVDHFVDFSLCRLFILSAFAWNGANDIKQEFNIVKTGLFDSLWPSKVRELRLFCSKWVFCRVDKVKSRQSGTLPFFFVPYQYKPMKD